MPRQAVYEASLRYFLNPIGPFLDDPSVTEVMVNGHDQIYIERRGCLEHTTAAFTSEDALRSAINNLAQSVGRVINEDNPVLDGRLPDGSRVHAIIPPGARGGTCLTIRKFSAIPLTLENLIEYGSLTPATVEFLDVCVRLRKNVIISGGSGTGKTSMLGALSRATPEGERIIVIEDTSELRLYQKHCLYLEAQLSTRKAQKDLNIRELFRASLRMRPDRIIVGEVRGGEALDLIQSMISGHEGSLSTVHASSAIDAMVRLETLSLMSDIEIPVYVARAQVASAIDVIVQLTRSNEDGRRRVSSISEARRLTSDHQYEIVELYKLLPVTEPVNGKQTGRAESSGLSTISPTRSMAPLRSGESTILTPTGELPLFASEPFEHGMGDRIEKSHQLWTDPKSKRASDQGTQA